MELWQYYRILRKRKWLILLGSLICIGIVFSLTYLVPERYRATTTVVEKLPTDVSVNIYGGQYLQLDPRLHLSNMAQLILSNEVMSRSYETLTNIGTSEDPLKILSSIKVVPVMDTMIMAISITSRSQEDARNCANIVANEFINFQKEMSLSGPKKTREFIEKELPNAEARLTKVRTELRDFKKDTGIVEIQRQTDVILQRTAQAENSMMQYQIQANQASARIRSLEIEMKKNPETRVAAEVVTSNPVWQSLKLDLSKQEIDLQKMLKDRTKEHPEVKALMSQIAETKSELSKTGATILSSTSTQVNPVYDQLVRDYTASIAERDAAVAAAASAQSEVNSLKAQMSNLPGNEMSLAQLQLEEKAAENTYSLLKSKLDEAVIKEQEAESNAAIEVVDAAVAKPANPRKMLELVLAIILSPILLSGVAFFLNYLDNSVKTPKEAADLLKLPISAAVPSAKAFCLTDEKQTQAIGASYQMLSTDLWISSTEMESRTILVASAEPKAGRSSTAVNLAITMAKDGARVILVDSDLRQPSMHELLETENDQGLSNILVGELEIKDALKQTSVKDLLFIPAGPPPANPIRLFKSEEMAKLVGELNEMADFVIFDSPAGIAFADGTLLAAMVKNVVLVYAAGTVPRGSEEEFRNRLLQVHANILGVVLNKVKPEDSHGYYHYKIAYDELLRDRRMRPALPARDVSAVDSGSDDYTQRS